jgi:hypothetical protein
MTKETLDRSMDQAPATFLTSLAVPAPTTRSVSKSAVVVGVCFLAATFSFALGNALIHSTFSRASAPGILVAGVFLLGCCGVAVAANGAAMWRILTPHALIHARAYLVLRVVECLTLVAVGSYLLASEAHWSAYVLAVYAVSGAAGLVLSSALLTSRLVPRNLAMLGVIGYPVFLVGSVLAIFHVIAITHGPGMLALVPGGLFELILPLWLFTKGFALHPVDAGPELLSPAPTQ